MRFSFRKRTVVPLVLVLVVVVFVVLRALGVLDPIQSLGRRVLSPVQGSFYSLGVGVRSFGDRFRNAKDVRGENDRLKREVQELTVENVRLMGELEELRSLAPQLSLLAVRKLHAIPSRIIGRVSEDRQLFLLDRGREDGLSTGTGAIVGNGALVGKITEVNPSTSHLLFLTDSRSSVAAQVAGSPAAKGVVRGERGLTLAFTLVPQGEKLAVGDRVVTAGLEKAVPADLLIGVVESLETKPGDLYQTARVRPAAELDAVRLVSVVVPGP